MAVRVGGRDVTDEGQWTSAVNRRSAIGRPGDDGRFKVGTLPPGRYYAIALDHADASQWGDPDFLAALSAYATTFSLAQSDMSTLDLKLFTIP
jgi:hypothetical protein